MTGLLLLATILTNEQGAPDETARLSAVRRVADLGKRVEEVCRPYYRTSPATPVQIVRDLPISAISAEEWDPGEYYVKYGQISGVVRGSRLHLQFGTVSPPPKGARRWTREECIVNARAVAELLKPEGYALGESYNSHPENPDDVYILTDVVLKEDPRLVVGRIDLPMDGWIGLPEHVWDDRPVYPEVAPERVRGVLDEEALAEEALRVNRTLPSIGPARLVRSPYTYGVPDFRKLVNELTPEHLGHIERREAIPIYQWGLMALVPQGRLWRSIWTDARTGRAMAYRDTLRRNPLSSRPEPQKPMPSLDTGRWRLGKVEGASKKVDGAMFEGVPAVVTNAAGEVRTLRFEAKSGSVRDESGTYRPDAALLRALRAEEPPQPFGKAMTTSEGKGR